MSAEKNTKNRRTERLQFLSHAENKISETIKPLMNNNMWNKNILLKQAGISVI
jgi:hypothetical protein